MLRPALSISNGLGLNTQQVGGASTPTPPSVAPILDVMAELGSFVAELSWTASNKITSPGFGYEVYGQVDGGGFSLLTTVTTLFYNYDAGSTAGDWEFYVKPVNTAGEGPSSNTVDVTLPGEFSGSYLVKTSGGKFLLNAGGAILING